MSQDLQVDGPRAPRMQTAIERVRALLESAVEGGVVPGAVVLVLWRGEKVLHDAYGSAQVSQEHRPMQVDAIFDLASVTKPLATTAVALALADRGVLSLDEELTRYLPELRTARGTGVTARRVLSHTSGLPGWRPLYVWGTEREDMLRAIDDLGMAYEPGSRFEYSDLGFIALGIALERIGARRLDALAEELVFAPCGLHSTGYLLELDEQSFAVTERGNQFERRMAEWAGLFFPSWRETFYPGQVNDGNAHYGLGGVSGHAGLFSDATEVGVLGQMWLNGGAWNGRRVLSQASVELATTKQTPAGDAARGLGWVLASKTPPGREELARSDAGFFPPVASPWTPRPCGELISGFGHTGFTGTSIWVDPSRELVAVLLTNATHPFVDLHKDVNRLRARLHNLLAASLDHGDGTSSTP